MAPEEAIRTIRSLTSLDEVARLLDTSAKRLNYFLYGSGRGGYREFSIPKKGGGTRSIAAPVRPRCIWQSTFADLLRDAYRPRTAVHGFCLDRSTVSHAARHVGKSFVLNLDLEDFFGSIHFGRVRGMLMSRPFGLEVGVASTLAHLFCFNKTLPQGAPSSPAISNWVCRSLDNSLSALAQSVGCDYGRFADDITFSGYKSTTPRALVESTSGKSVVLGKPLLDAIAEAGFAVNQRKVWVRNKSQRQEVTGLVVNEKVNTRRGYYRNVRAALHSWRALGYDVANDQLLARYITRHRQYSSKCLANWLRGKIAYLQAARDVNYASENTDTIGALLEAEFRVLHARDLGSTLRAVAAYPRTSSAADFRAIRRSLWLVLVKDDAGHELSQGSAFAIDDGQLLTSAHVVEDALEPRTTIEIRSADSLTQAYAAKISRLSGLPVDLAVLETAAPLSMKLQLATGIPVAQSRVTLAGFSNWNSIADGHRVVDSEIVQLQHRSLVHRIGVAASLSSGMSGGPMIQDGRVIGVITDAHDSSRLVNAAVSTQHVSALPML